MHFTEKKIFLGILVCVLVSVVGISFAYFTTGFNFSGNGASTRVSTADLVKVSYDAGDGIMTLDTVNPGDKTSKTFYVTVTPKNNHNTAKYAIQLVIGNNEFVKCDSSNKNEGNNCILDYEELTYTLKEGSSVVQEGNLIGKSGTITLGEVTKTVSEAEKFTYTLEIDFAKTNADQNHNMNKKFNAQVKVVFAE